MMWQLQELLAFLMGPEGTNLIFALLCLWAATGRGGRWCAGTTALLHLLLILI